MNAPAHRLALSAAILLAFALATTSCSTTRPRTARSAQEAAPERSARAPEILDPGFESGALALSPVGGWYSDALAQGQIEVHPDTRDKVEGLSSLAIEIIQPRERRFGLYSVFQTIDAGAPAAGSSDLEFSIALKAAGLPSAKVVFYVWDEDHRAQTIAEREVVLAQSGWERARLRVQVPSGHERVGVFIYYAPEVAGARLWLDDATLRPAVSASG